MRVPYAVLQLLVNFNLGWCESSGKWEKLTLAIAQILRRLPSRELRVLLTFCRCPYRLSIGDKH
jgi:hypothetical protein